MPRTCIRLVLVSVVLMAGFFGPIQTEAQTTFRACRVPGVGAIYMVGLSGLPADCLDGAHVEFSWTEGGSGVIDDGAVTSAKILDGAVGSDDLADAAVTAPKLAAGIMMWAMVGATGNLIGGSVGLTSFRNDTGEYAVTVPAGLLGSQGDCALLATSNFADRTAAVRHGSAAGLSADQVEVRMWTSAGTFEDHAFSLLIVCTD